MNFRIEHIQYIERSFVENRQIIDAAKSHWRSLQDPLRELVSIKSLPGINLISQNNFPGNTLTQRMEDLLAGAYGTEQSIVYCIVGNAQGVNLFINTFSYSQPSFQKSSSSENLISSLLKVPIQVSKVPV